MRLNTERRGFALAAAIGAMVVIGALIAGVFFASTQEFRIGRNALYQTRALSAAEYGVGAIVQRDSATGWRQAWNAAAIGPVATRAYNPADGSTDTVRLSRLTLGLYYALSDGSAGVPGNADAGARRRLGVLIALAAPNINIRGALTVNGATKVAGSSLINGNDTQPTGWSCPSSQPALPGIAAADPSQVNACSGCVTGSPAIQSDPAAGDTSTYFDYGGTTWTELTAAAEKVVSGTLTGVRPTFNSDGTCRTTDNMNWGDPAGGATSGCANYFPIIYAPGDLTINGDRGQGILLVNGDLSVQGGFQFFGPVIVRGRLKTAGTGGHFNGGVMAANVDLAQNTVTGNAVINYSSCAVAKASLAAGRPTILRARSWAELR